MSDRSYHNGDQEFPPARRPPAPAESVSTAPAGGAAASCAEGLLALIPAGAAVCDGPGGRRLRLNRRGAATLGLVPAPGPVVEYAYPITAPFQRHDGSDPLPAILTGQAVLAGEPARLCRADGSTVQAVLCAAPLRDSDGAVSGALVIFEETPGDPPAAHADAERLAALGALTAGIIHEINNPLNSIMVNAELGLLALEKGTLGKGNGEERLRRVLRTIVADVKRCGSITHSVLQLARADGVPCDVHDLNGIVRQAVELVGSYCQMHDMALELDLGAMPPIPLDPTTMEHVVINLLRNAVEAGGAGVHLRVATRCTDGGVTLTVSDDGPGIARDHLARLFDPLSSTSGKHRGNGLGLSLVQRIIAGHGGTIHVSSEPGAGTTFLVRLPGAAARD